MSVSGLFGELRSVLSDTPSLVGWRTLCGLFDRASQRSLVEVCEQWMPYASAHLKSWPDLYRECPATWRESLSLGDGVPMLQLVRSLALEPGDAPHVILSNIQHSPYTQALRRLVLDRFGLLNPSHARAFEGVRLEQIRSLSCRGVWADASSMMMCLQACHNVHTLSIDMISTSGLFGDDMMDIVPTTLKTLNLGHTSITEDVLWSCVECAFWNQLEVLSLAGAAMSPDAIMPLLRMTRLKTLDASDTRMFPTSTAIEHLLEHVPTLKTIHASHLPDVWDVPCELITRRLPVF